MATDTLTPLDIPAVGMPVKAASGCGGACGCGGGGLVARGARVGGGWGCGGWCGGGLGGVSMLALPAEDGTESPWTPAPPGSQPVYAAAGGSDALDQALATIERVRQAALAPLRAQESGGPTQLSALG